MSDIRKKLQFCMIQLIRFCFFQFAQMQSIVQLHTLFSHSE